MADKILDCSAPLPVRYGLQFVGLQSNGYIMQTISTIAREITRDWKKVNYAAKPYLDAMRYIDTATDKYGFDDARSVVSYFLANASGYRGDAAKANKAALKAIVGLK